MDYKCRICNHDIIYDEGYENYICEYCDELYFECPECNFFVNDKDSSCPNCGVELNFITEEYVETAEIIDYCPSCGEKIDSNAAFCAGCGAEINIRNQVIEKQNVKVVDENPKGLKYVLNGSHGRSMLVYQNKVVIKTDFTIGSFITNNATDGEKTIYYSDVIGIQAKPIGVTVGYIQLETAGSLMNNKNSNFFNENTFTYSTIPEERITMVVDFIKEKIEENKNQKNHVVKSTLSIPDEIKKYKELLDMGAITEEEYEKKKKELLNI